MSPHIALTYFLPAVAFAIGACIGSFLNVVIYRLPREISLDKPRRSFCPNCKKQIPAWLNIPLITWLMLRGKCRWCRKEIPLRYFVVELLTAICFLAIWKLYFPSVGIWGVIALWVLAALLIAATYIDLDFMIIPDSISLGGLGVGLIFSAAIPALHGEKTWLTGLTAGLIGGAVGFVLLWCVVMLGKLIFGQIKHEFDEPVDFEISQPGGEDEPIIIQLGPDDQYDWNEVFYRPWDRMEMEVSEVKFDGEPLGEACTRLRAFESRFETGDRTIALEDLKCVTGKVTRAVVPREAMGTGDVKFLAMIGAFQGWQAVLITLMAGCCIGAVIGSIQKWLSKDNRIPFGPYLALGAFIWIFTGLALWKWYSGLWQPGFR